ncbi:MAG: U32 family peptidase, partial [Acidobacteriota bacterium]|nr:U32 family peptidase [Acidobacteriota bacterium]
AQPCRSRYTLTDGDERRIVQDKFLLSMKDLDLMGDLPALVATGVTSFKIEGRYKEAEYVKNVTAAWRQALDVFITSHPGYRRPSSGRSEAPFTPDPARSFNRGFTRYFISGEREKVASIHTQKSIGKPVGTIARMGGDSFQIDGEALHNGDGLCFFTEAGELSGFRVERTGGDGGDGGDSGEKLFPSSMKGLAKGLPLYRNYDIAFHRLLDGDSARRRIAAVVTFVHDGDVVRMTATDEDGNCAELSFDAPYEEPRDAAQARSRAEKQIAAAGNTVFRIERTEFSSRVGFFPASRLNQMKREILAELEKVREARRPRELAVIQPNSAPCPEKRIDFHGNILNRHARMFYERHGAEVVEPAFETLADLGAMLGRDVMKTRYCLRYQLDACLRDGAVARRLQAPLRLRDTRHVYRLEFDCEKCQMSVILEK